MKYPFITVFLVTAIAITQSFAGTPSENELHRISVQALEKLKTVQVTPFKRTTVPEAQWFPDASFGLFMHWGIHSVAGIQPSWAMIQGYPYGTDRSEYWGKGYYTLLTQFNPDNYDPDKWIKAAKDAGMTYAVLTTKHHDGYALWPSEYGNMSTKQYMNSRDLLRPYVEACRKYGIKVGFYYSPPDWAFPGYPLSCVYGKEYVPEPGTPAFDKEKLYEYNVGQLSEILTRYGKIDLLWFDGGINNAEKVLAWVRTIQPEIVINNRSGGGGDFETPECSTPGEAPAGWWEECNIWSGHWGYSPDAHFESNAWVLEKLATARSWGGNFLLNIGPKPDGTMRQGYYERTKELAGWMEHSKESLIGAGVVNRNWDKFSNVPLTRRPNIWYLHILPDHKGAVEIKDIPKPKEARLLKTKSPVKFVYKTGNLSITLPDSLRTELDDVIALYWEKEPKK